MNTTFKARVLQHLNHKKEERGEKGFTLIELLVVIIIIGILAAIALPSFLNQANKGKQAEAKQYVASVNKGQQAYYTEQGVFVTGTDENAWGQLGVGIKTQTTNYKYSIEKAGEFGVNSLATQMTDVKGLKSYTGVVGVVAPADGADKTSQAVVCESPKADVAPDKGSVGGTDKEVKCPGTMVVLGEKKKP